MPSPAAPPSSARLLILLSIATFFEGYDLIALTQVLPEVRQDLGLGPRHAGLLVGVSNVGTVAAWLLVRQADRWGRRKTMMVTLAGYTVCTLLTGLSPDVWTLAIAQLFAKLFLIAEWALSMVYAAEEFPAHRRGTVIGVVQAFSSLGAVACAGLVPVLKQLPWGWRSVYFAGALPLVLLWFARRNLPETQRFQTLQPQARRPLLHLWRTPYRRRMLQVAGVWALTYLCTQNVVTFWKEFAQAERGLDDRAVAGSVTIAAIVAMPLVFLSGRLLDGLGRRGGAVVIYGVGALATVGAYTLPDRWSLTIALVGGIFAASAVLPVLNAWTTELFPTDLRGDAYAWCNNLLGRVGYVLGPMGVGLLAEQVGWGPAVAGTAVPLLLGLGLALATLPETRGRELEETAAL